MNNLTISTVTTEQAFDALRQSWTELYDQISCLSPFSSFDWNRNWWKYFGSASNKSLFILTIKLDEKLIGIAPFYKTVKNGVNILRFISTGNADYLDLIVLPGREQDCITALLTYLGTNSKLWDVLDLVDLPQTSPNYQILSVQNMPALKKVVLSGLICPYIRSEKTYTEFLAGKSSNFRYDLKRKMKKALALGNISFELIRHSSPKIDIATLASLYEKRWAAKDTNATIRTASGQKLLHEMLPIWEKQNILAIPVIFLNDKVMAFCVGFIRGERFYYYIPSFDPEFMNASPGKLLVEFIVKHLNIWPITELDFMKGEERYKLDWSETYRQNNRIIINNSSLKSTISASVLMSFLTLRNAARTMKLLRWLRFELLGKIKKLLKRSKQNDSL